MIDAVRDACAKRAPSTTVLVVSHVGACVGTIVLETEIVNVPPDGSQIALALFGAGVSACAVATGLMLIVRSGTRMRFVSPLAASTVFELLTFVQFALIQRFN